MRTNKPNFREPPGPGGRLYKQSQFTRRCPGLSAAGRPDVLCHRGRSRETKPISCPGRVGRGLEDAGRGVLYKQTQFDGIKCAKQTQSGLGAREWARAAGAGRLRRGAIVRNEANLARRPAPQRAKCAKRTQFPPVPGGSGPEGRAAIVQNEPNWARAPRDGHGRGREAPPQSNRAKQSQFPLEQREGQVLCRKGFMVNRTGNGLRQNEANLPAWTQTGTGWGVTKGAVAQGYCAKRTQFAPDGQGRPSPRPEALTMPPTGNKRAKRTQFARRRRMGRDPRGVGRGANHAIRTQFGAARADRAKQSQFPWQRSPPRVPC
jgi:hypothetical protein